MVLHLFEEYGIDFLQKLNGMFGLAIWDRQKHELLLARDRIGIKPLYYYHNNGLLVFASEIKSILKHPGVDAEIDFRGLGLLFKHGFTPAPFTVYKHIKKIPPAHYVIIKNRQIGVKQYWDVSYRNKYHKPVDELADHLYALLKDSVGRQMATDVPLGIFLSGGIDSSGIVHLMSELAHSDINTYSIGFGSGFERYNETCTANQFAVEKNTNHHEAMLKDDLATLFSNVVEHLDEPLGDSSFLATYAISKFASQSVKVILSGIGGDELFGGYRRYLNVRLNSYSLSVPISFRKGVMKLANRLPVDRNSALLNYFRLARGYVDVLGLPMEQQYERYTSLFSVPLLSEIMVDKEEIPDLFAYHLNKCDSDSMLDRLMYVDMKTSLPEQLLLLTDKMTMAASVEARVPFLDHRLVEFAARVPDAFKLNGLRLRYIQKKAFSKVLPSYILKGRKKGFGAPVGNWVRNELWEMVNDLLSFESLKVQGIFNPKFVRNIVVDHSERRKDYTDQLTLLLTFQLWYRGYIES